MRQSEEGDDGDGDDDNDEGGESDEEGAGPTPAHAASAQPLGALQRQGGADAALPCNAGAAPASEQLSAGPPPAAADPASPGAADAEVAASAAVGVSTRAGPDAACESIDEQGCNEPIWSRTRARLPLEHVTLEELESLLGEVNDDQLWPALVDEDAAYQQFLDVRLLVPSTKAVPHGWCQSNALSQAVGSPRHALHPSLHAMQASAVSAQSCACLFAFTSLLVHQQIGLLMAMISVRHFHLAMRSGSA